MTFVELFVINLGLAMYTGSRRHEWHNDLIGCKHTCVVAVVYWIAADCCTGVIGVAGGPPAGFRLLAW